MENQTILDVKEESFDLEERLKVDRLNHIKIIAGLAIINTIFYLLFIETESSFLQKASEAIYSVIIGYTIIGFLLGLLVALIPYKRLSYQKRYLRASLLAMLALHSLTSLLLILNFFLFLIKLFA